MANRLTEISPGVFVATAVAYVTTTTVVAGKDGGCLVIDPAVTVEEIEGLAASMASLGLRPVVGWSTHAHWDHMLWHPSLGDVVRYATPAAVTDAAKSRAENVAGLDEEAAGHDHSLFGQITPLAGDIIRWEGPPAQVISHDGHAPGHGAVFLPESGVLIAGDMCSDIEMPLLMNDDAGDQLAAYRTGLDRLAAVPGLRWVVPGHGHVGDGAEFRRRVALDHAYLDQLSADGPVSDPRITSDFLRGAHEAQLREVRAHA